MNPPYEVTPRIIKLITGISEKLGEVKALYMDQPSPTLRKRNKIKTIHSSLKIEGNTLSLSQITALLDNKRVIGPINDILEVKNAIEVYENLDSYNPHSSRSFLQAHKTLMKGLLKRSGTYRTKNVGILKGSEVAHLAPPASNVKKLMNNLFDYLKKSDDLVIIKSCVFHYEMEFIHPFIDGNGRMGRLWQSVILKKEYPVFGYLPFETMISENQSEYYNALSKSDKAGSSTIFIEYMLDVINRSLEDILAFKNRPMKREDRLKYFNSQIKGEFTRMDYMEVFKDISTSTASRDLHEGVKRKMYKKIGDKNKTSYRLIIKE